MHQCVCGGQWTAFRNLSSFLPVGPGHATEVTRLVAGSVLTEPSCWPSHRVFRKLWD